MGGGGQGELGAPRCGPCASSLGCAGLAWAATVSQVSAMAGEVGGQGSRASEVPTDHLCPCPHIVSPSSAGRQGGREIQLGSNREERQEIEEAEEKVGNRWQEE